MTEICHHLHTAASTSSAMILKGNLSSHRRSRFDGPRPAPEPHHPRWWQGAAPQLIISPAGVCAAHRCPTAAVAQQHTSWQQAVTAARQQWQREQRPRDRGQSRRCAYDSFHPQVLCRMLQLFSTDSIEYHMNCSSTVSISDNDAHPHIHLFDC